MPGGCPLQPKYRSNFGGNKDLVDVEDILAIDSNHLIQQQSLLLLESLPTEISSDEVAERMRHHRIFDIFAT
jgi:hypothetical protein